MSMRSCARLALLLLCAVPAMAEGPEPIYLIAATLDGTDAHPLVPGEEAIVIGRPTTLPQDATVSTVAGDCGSRQGSGGAADTVDCRFNPADARCGSTPARLVALYVVTVGSHARVQLYAVVPEGTAAPTPGDRLYALEFVPHAGSVDYACTVGNDLEHVFYKYRGWLTP
jgi:hypothetical protein